MITALAKALAVSAMLIVYLICGTYVLFHPHRYRGPVWVLASALAPLAIGMIALVLRGKLSNVNSSSKPAAPREEKFWTALVFLAFFPAFIGVYGYACICASIFSSDSESFTDWARKTSRPLLHLAMFLPQIGLAYYLAGSGAPRSGLYIAVCCSLVALTSPLLGLGLGRGVLEPYKRDKQDASPSFVLTCAVIFAASFGALHFALWALDHAAYSNLTRWDDALYFSVVTMSTVGYGDIIPVSRAARWSCMLEIISGFVLLVFAVNASMTAWGQSNEVRRSSKDS